MESNGTLNRLLSLFKIQEELDKTIKEQIHKIKNKPISDKDSKLIIQ